MSAPARGTPVVYDAANRQLSCQNRTIHLEPVAGRISLRAYVDRSHITLFANDGEVFMPVVAVPRADNLRLGLAATGAGATIHSLQIHELASIWK